MRKRMSSSAEYIGGRGQPGELKHLSTLRKRKQSDSLSSGERKGISLNQVGVKHVSVAHLGLWGLAGPGYVPAGKLQRQCLAEGSGKAHHRG